MTPADLVEIEAIKQLKARYFRLMDQKRWDEWADVFTEDATLEAVDDTRGAKAVEGRDAIVARVRSVLGEVLSVHHGHMPEIEITGPTTARGTWTMEDHLEFPPGGRTRVIDGRGFYFEEYAKGPDGRWRIRTLQLRRLWLRRE